MALNAALLLSHADAGFIGLIEHDQIHLVRAVGGYTESWIPLESSIAARAIRAQQAELVREVESDPDYHAQIVTTNAEMVVPLTVRNKVIGVLNLESAEPNRFSDEMFKLVQVLAAHIAAPIENARLYEGMQEQLAETRSLYAQVSQQEQLKTHMIRVAAHDLRGPLAIIGSYIDLLHEDLSAYYGELDDMYVNAIRQAVARMTQMTADILSLERLNEHHDITLMRVQLGALLEHAVEEYGEESRKRSQTVRLDVEPVSVYGDSTELHEAITNLIENAIKYTRDGGMIVACLERDGNSALLEISDNGYGIPKDQQQDLFQPFRRIKTQETRGIDGTGLGLYLVKTIIQRHGGSVHFESEHGKGSRFGFRLPLAKLGE